MTIPSYVDLYVKLSNEWHHALRLPTEVVVRLSLHPWKWLHYAAHCVVGSPGVLKKGELEADSIVILSTNEYAIPAEDHAQLAEKYYFDPTGPPHLADVDSMRGSVLTKSSGCSSSRNNFRTAIVARDTDCVVSGGFYSTEAAHIIPYAKGDTYIHALTTKRGHEDQVIDDICDIRNGLLLRSDIHHGFDQYPKPLLDVVGSGMPLTQPPEDRLIFQWLMPFTPDKLPITGQPNNNDTRISPVPITRPSPVVLDFAYGAALLRRWGASAAFRAFVVETVKPDYYPAQQESQDPSQADPATQARKQEERELNRRIKRGQGGVTEGVYDHFDVIAALWKITLEQVQDQSTSNTVEHVGTALSQEGRSRLEAWRTKVQKAV